MASFLDHFELCCRHCNFLTVCEAGPAKAAELPALFFMDANLIVVGRLNGKDGTLIESNTGSAYRLVPGPSAGKLPPDGMVEVRAYLSTIEGNLLYREIVPFDSAPPTVSP